MGPKKLIKSPINARQSVKMCQFQIGKSVARDRLRCPKACPGGSCFAKRIIVASRAYALLSNATACLFVVVKSCVSSSRIGIVRAFVHMVIVGQMR